jgi:signal transduction histidine kinase
MKQLFKKIRHSLSMRLLLMFMAAGVLIIILFQTLIGLVISRHVAEEVAPHAHQYLSYVQQDIGSPPDVERAKALVQKLPIQIMISGPVTNWASSDSLPTMDHLHNYQHHQDPNKKIKVGYDRGQASVLIRDETSAGVYETLIWNNSLKEKQRRGLGMLFVLGVLLTVLGLLYWFIRRMFRPIQVIKSGVETIGSGDLTHRIQTDRDDELGELAGSINHMADDIEQMLEAKRELLLAISHELRSPLTRAKVSTALLEPSANQKNITRDINEMESMITELLEAERLNGRHQSLQKVDVTINEIVMSVVDDYFADETIDLTLAEAPPLQQLDPTRLRLVAKNLLENAFKHNGEDSPAVRLITRSNANEVTIEIEDFGAGIPDDHLPHITEPFYRADASRQRKTGGFGLGLYLVKLIVEAHDGTLKIGSEVGKGTRVIVTLPL